MDTLPTQTPQDTHNLEPKDSTDSTANPQKTAKQLLKQAFFFTCFSAGAAIVQIVSFTLLNEICTLTYWPAYLISLLLSVIFNFVFNRKITFKSTNNVPRAFCLVILYYAIFTPLSTMLGQNLTDIGWNEYIILIGTMLINFVTEFFYQKLFVFDKKASATDSATSEDGTPTDTNATETQPVSDIKPNKDANKTE